MEGEWGTQSHAQVRKLLSYCCRCRGDGDMKISRGCHCYVLVNVNCKPTKLKPGGRLWCRGWCWGRGKGSLLKVAARLKIQTQSLIWGWPRMVMWGFDAEVERANQAWGDNGTDGNRAVDNNSVFTMFVFYMNLLPQSRWYWLPLGENVFWRVRHQGMVQSIHQGVYLNMNGSIVQ